MKKMFAAAAISLTALSGTAFAQDALAAARAAGVCDVTGAEYLADGRLKITCRPGSVTEAAGGAVAEPVLAGTALGGGGAAAIAGLVLIVALAGGDDGSSTTTTTTTTTSTTTTN